LNGDDNLKPHPTIPQTSRIYTNDLEKPLDKGLDINAAKLELENLCEGLPPPLLEKIQEALSERHPLDDYIVRASTARRSKERSGENIPSILTTIGTSKGNGSLTTTMNYTKSGGRRNS
jgi:hypothetical protein